MLWTICFNIEVCRHVFPSLAGAWYGVCLEVPAAKSLRCTAHGWLAKNVCCFFGEQLPTYTRSTNNKLWVTRIQWNEPIKHIKGFFKLRSASQKHKTAVVLSSEKHLSWGDDPIWRTHFSDGWFNHQLESIFQSNESNPPTSTQQRHETVVRLLQEMYVAFQSDAVRLALLQRPDILLFSGVIWAKSKWSLVV